MFKTHRTYTLSTGVKNNTIAVFNEVDTVNVIYHKTVVFTATRQFKKAKDQGDKWTVTLNNGGWDTVSTRAVINRALEQIPGFESARLERKKVKKELFTVYKDGIIEIPFTSNTLTVQ